MYRPVRGVVRNFSRGVKFFLSFPGDAQHPLGPENPLKLKDFTGHGEGLVPIAPPPDYASEACMLYDIGVAFI